MCQTASKFMPHLSSEEHEFVAENKLIAVPHPTFSSDEAWVTSFFLHN